MKIKCINIYNDYIKEYQKKSTHLTIGKEYIVLEAMISAAKELSYRLIDDGEDEMPAIYKASQFQITSELISSNWNTAIINKSLIILGPKAWQQEEFWDSCYDMDPIALEIYKHEARIIFQEESDI